jgi:hypothetical protein
MITDNFEIDLNGMICDVTEQSIDQQVSYIVDIQDPDIVTANDLVNPMTWQYNADLGRLKCVEEDEEGDFVIQGLAISLSNAILKRNQ